MATNLDYTAEILEVKEYFEDHGIDLTDNFSILICAESIIKSIKTTSIILCNLEDEKVMKQIADGEYDELDLQNANIFNDSYYEMSEFLNI